jgi:hypothetical protein
VDRCGRSVSPFETVVDAASAHYPQQSADPLAADPDAHPEPQLGVHPRSAVGAA